MLLRDSQDTALAMKFDHLSKEASGKFKNSVDYK
jgi:hypothetical protein